MVENCNESTQTIHEITGLTLYKLPVTPVLEELLEPGDRRFMALSWNGGLGVFDGWTEYALEVCPLRDVFGEERGFGAVFEASGLKIDALLIDFAQGQIWSGSEVEVEEILENAVGEWYRHSPLSAVLDSAVSEKLDGNLADGV